jgi:hypothetical protein
MVNAGWVSRLIYGLQPRGLRCGVRRPCQGVGNCRKATDNHGAGHGFHGCPGRNQAHSLGRTGPKPDVRDPISEAHLYLAEGQPPDSASSLRSDGVQATRESQDMRKPTNGPSLQRRSLMFTGRNGHDSRIGAARDQCPCPGPSDLAHFKRDISEKKLAEARRWAGG